MPKLAAPEAQESCRTDYGSFSYQVIKNEQIQELVTWTDDLARFLLPAGKWEGPHRGRHFTHVLKHDTGISLEFTPPTDAARNSGVAVVNLPGAIWGADYRCEVPTGVLPMHALGCTTDGFESPDLHRRVR